nr:MAG TPA: hypothetical protein [Caudoviricetes sp.]
MAGYISPAHGVGDNARQAFAVFGNETHLPQLRHSPHLFCRYVHLQVLPADFYLPCQRGAFHGDAHLQRFLAERQSYVLKRHGDTPVKECLRRFFFECSVHTLLPWFSVGHIIGSTAVVWRVHRQLTLYLGDFGQGELATKVGHKGGTRYRHGLTALQLNLTLVTEFHKVGRGFPTGIGSLRADKRSTKGELEVLVVQLYEVERGGYSAVLRDKSQHGGTGHLLGIHIHFLGLGSTPVPAALLYIADCLVTKLYDTDAVHEFLTFCHIFLVMIVNTVPVATPTIKAMRSIFHGFELRSLSVLASFFCCSNAFL